MGKVWMMDVQMDRLAPACQATVMDANRESAVAGSQGFWSSSLAALTDGIRLIVHKYVVRTYCVPGPARSEERRQLPHRPREEDARLPLHALTAKRQEEEEEEATSESPTGHGTGERPPVQGQTTLSQAAGTGQTPRPSPFMSGTLDAPFPRECSVHPSRESWQRPQRPQDRAGGAGVAPQPWLPAAAPAGGAVIRPALPRLQRRSRGRRGAQEAKAQRSEDPQLLRATHRPERTGLCRPPCRGRVTAVPRRTVQLLALGNSGENASGPRASRKPWPQPAAASPTAPSPCGPAPLPAPPAPPPHPFRRPPGSSLELLAGRRRTSKIKAGLRRKDPATRPRSARRLPAPGAALGAPAAKAGEAAAASANLPAPPPPVLSARVPPPPHKVRARAVPGHPGCGLPGGRPKLGRSSRRSLRGLSNNAPETAGGAPETAPRAAPPRTPRHCVGAPSSQQLLGVFSPSLQRPSPQRTPQGVFGLDPSREARDTTAGSRPPRCHPRGLRPPPGISARLGLPRREFPAPGIVPPPPPPRPRSARDSPASPRSRIPGPSHSQDRTPSPEELREPRPREGIPDPEGATPPRAPSPAPPPAAGSQAPLPGPCPHPQPAHGRGNDRRRARRAARAGVLTGSAVPAAGDGGPAAMPRPPSGLRRPGAARAPASRRRGAREAGLGRLRRPRLLRPRELLGPGPWPLSEEAPPAPEQPPVLCVPVMFGDACLAEP
ncbi:basic proline-rich protein-like [Lepus europaeus]|uniref:basic proline-rich protein-like n=1 Tax=Lepus europaeus TaxID=9983 RepID=UPI002B4A9687|nr:basic proline-rich protein-like [Lepus europaeus]